MKQPCLHLAAPTSPRASAVASCGTTLRTNANGTDHFDPAARVRFQHDIHTLARSWLLPCGAPIKRLPPRRDGMSDRRHCGLFARAPLQADRQC